MSSKKSINATEIIGRAKKALNVKTDLQLADILGVKHNTISSWKSRNVINFETLVEKCDNISLDWLIYGEGTPDGTPQPEFDPHDESSRIDQMILETLKDVDLDKKRYIAEYVEREKFFWEFKKKNAEIDDNGEMRKAG